MMEAVPRLSTGLTIRSYDDLKAFLDEALTKSTAMKVKVGQKRSFNPPPLPFCLVTSESSQSPQATP